MASSSPQPDHLHKATIFDCPQDFVVKYRMTIEKDLGRGMAGSVVLASFKDDPEEKKALKILAKGENPSGHFTDELFVREIGILQQLQHPNILTDVMAFNCPDSYVMCMPYFQHGCLTQYLPRMTDALIQKYLGQLTSAVAYLHRRAVVHRDVKPDNVLIDDQGDAVLIDFGLASKLVSPSERLEAVGTKAYMAPELLTGTPDDLFKCDVYSLGVVFLNMTCKKELPLTVRYLDHVKNSPDIPSAYRLVLVHLLDANPRTRWNGQRLLQALAAIAWKVNGAKIKVKGQM